MNSAQAADYLFSCAFDHPDRHDEVLGLVRPYHFPEQVQQRTWGKLDKGNREGGIDPAILHDDFKAMGYFDTTRQRVPSIVSAPEAAAIVIESWRKRQLADSAAHVIECCRNGRSAESIFYEWKCALEDFGREAASNEPRYRIYSAAELDSQTFETTFAIDNLMVTGQPLVIGAPEKGLKTTLMLAAGVALCAGDRFLDASFPVNQRGDFLMFSGESGMSALQESARRICRQMGCELSALDGFNISPDLPQLDDIDDVMEFEAIVSDYKPATVAIDPMMLCLGDVEEKAANMFSMGKLLRRLNEACQKNDATLMFAHHTAGNPPYGATPKLSWLAFAGFKQFLRQWWLLNRMEEYEPGSGFHRLKFVAGGSAGHNGQWILEINEGSRNDIGGRRWEVAVKSVDEARQSDHQRKAESKAEEIAKCLENDRAAACRVLAQHPGGMAQTAIRDRAGISGRRWPIVLAEMLNQSDIIEAKVAVPNKKQLVDGYKLNTTKSA